MELLIQNSKKQITKICSNNNKILIALFTLVNNNYIKSAVNVLALKSKTEYNEIIKLYTTSKKIININDITAGKKEIMEVTL